MITNLSKNEKKFTKETPPQRFSHICSASFKFEISENLLQAVTLLKIKVNSVLFKSQCVYLNVNTVADAKIPIPRYRNGFFKHSIH